MPFTLKQQEAIESPPGHMQLIACAGSGKTEVVAQRIAYLLGRASLSLSPIVDEYQDVNPIQDCIVRVLADLGAHVCVVGDDDQTIFQWRGSDVENILTFASRFSDVKQVPMEENFRSSKGIVETARLFIARNDPGRLAKEMKSTDAQPYEAGDITALEFADPDERPGNYQILVKVVDIFGNDTSHLVRWEAK